MKFKEHTKNNKRIAELIADEHAIKETQDAVDILGNLYYEQYESVVLYETHLSEVFFNLKSGMAGNILQKFSNYSIRLAIVGEFSKYTKKSISDFMYESNKNKHINFVDSLEKALEVLSL